MNWSTFWSAASSIASLALLVVTGLYAWLTHRMAKTAEQQLWENSRPRLSVSLKTNQGGVLFLVHVENVGQAPAENLELRLDRPVHQTHGLKSALNEVPAFKGTIRSFPPRTPIRFLLGTYMSYFGKDADRNLHPLNFILRARYSREGVLFEEDFPIDIWEQEAATSLNRDYIAEFGRDFPEQFRRSLAQISQNLEEIGTPAQPKPRVKPRSWGGWVDHAAHRKYDH